MIDLQVLDGIELHGRVNIDEEQLYANIRAAVKRGHPQVKPHPVNSEHVLLVGSGPSLESTKDELLRLYWDGAKVVTVNGSYQWCLKNGIRPSAQVVMDGREANARFLTNPISTCQYFIASQCHSKVWDAVENHPNVWMFHAASEDGSFSALLNELYFGEHWVAIGGGTTVAMRALGLFRTLGFVRYDLFGVDSCWIDWQHHAFDQPENQADKRFAVCVHPADRPDVGRVFQCAPWHIKQCEDFLQFLKLNGEHFLLTVHGDGLLSYVIESYGADEPVISVEKE